MFATAVLALISSVPIFSILFNPSINRVVWIHQPIVLLQEMKAELKRYKKYVLEDHDRIAATKLLAVEKQVCFTVQSFSPRETE